VTGFVWRNYQVVEVIANADDCRLAIMDKHTQVQSRALMDLISLQYTACYGQPAFKVHVIIHSKQTSCEQ